MTSVLRLSSPNQRHSIAVDLDRGGRLQSFLVDGYELLVGSASSLLDWGLYPMVPFAGRVRDGLIVFEGKEHRLPPTNGPHAIHGYGFVRKWTQLDEQTISFDFDDPWPWQGRTIQTFELTDDSLTLQMTVEAIDRQPMQFGWHPWFRRDIGSRHTAELDFTPEEMFIRDNAGIPTGELRPPTSGPWDDCFRSLRSNPRLTWGGVRLELSSSLDHWTVYNEPEHALCVEPQLGPPNNVNSSPFILDAGEHYNHWFTIAWA